MRFKILFLLLIVILISCAEEDNNVLTPKEHEEFYERSEFKLIGHRGGVVSGNTKENSLDALNKAITNGYDMAEIDIRFSSDKIPIIHHNAYLNDLFPGEKNTISSLTFDEIEALKEQAGSLLPYSLEEFAELSNGDIGFLLDFKGDGYNKSEYLHCLDILNNYNISNLKVAWSKEAKEFLFQQDSVKIGINYTTFSQIAGKSESQREDYFLLVSAYDYKAHLIKEALDLGFEVVVSINEWAYKQRDITSRIVIKKDIQRMIDSGVRNFLLDATYEELFNFKE